MYLSYWYQELVLLKALHFSITLRQWRSSTYLNYQGWNLRPCVQSHEILSVVCVWREVSV